MMHSTVANHVRMHCKKSKDAIKRIVASSKIVCGANGRISVPVVPAVAEDT